MPPQINRYQLKKEIGQGGMATVYLAYDPRFKRDVAIKVLPRQFTFDPMFRARFAREAETIAGLEHPAIVPVYDFGEEEEQPYLVMRYMTGGSLADRLREGALSAQFIADIMRRLGGALDEAHRHHIIHRDLKPGNILFDHLENAYLSDFGIVKLAEGQNTITGSAIIGTPSYMSPEQARGESIDGRSDIYALGTILFEMLTGQQPYHADTPMGVMVKHLIEPVPGVLAVKQDLPPAYETVIKRAMAKNREDRYASAGDLATAVHAVVTGAALPAYVPPELEKTYVLPPMPETVPSSAPARPATPPKPPRRRRWVGGLLLVLLLLAVGLGGYGYASGWLLAAVPAATPTPTATSTATEVAESVAVALPTETPTVTAVPSPTATPLPSATRAAPATSTATTTPTATPSPTRTQLPTRTPTSAATAAATATTASATNNTPTPTATKAAAVAPAKPSTSLPITFDNFGCWSVGDQPNGTFCSSGEQAQSGTSGKLDYHFLTEDNDYVIFLVCSGSYSKCIGMPGEPTGLSVWVYGDGSGHFLNAWIVDSQDETWAVPLGSINFTGWKQITGCIAADIGWPGGHIAGPSNEVIDYPVAFRALVLDDGINDVVSEGAIYLDDLQVGSCS